MPKTCEFFDWNWPVCFAGAEASFDVCTEDYCKTCQWANEMRAEKGGTTYEFDAED